VNQVFVSTIPQADLSGQMTLFPLPADFAWLKHLDADGIVAFLKELFDAIRDSQHSDDWTGVNKVISAWEETALLMQDQVLMARVRQIRENPEPGVAYEVVREKLGI
jgi:hypothetical protein